MIPKVSESTTCATDRLILIRHWTKLYVIPKRCHRKKKKKKDFVNDLEDNVLFSVKTKKMEIGLSMCVFVCEIVITNDTRQPRSNTKTRKTKKNF